MARKRANPNWPAQKGAPNEMEPRPGAFTPQEAANLLKVDVSTIYRMCKRGELPHMKLGDTYRLGSAAIWALLNGMHEWSTREAAMERREL